MMGLGDVSQSVIPKPVLVSAGDSDHSVTSRYFTPRRCHASHAVTGAIGVATAFALPGNVASHPQPIVGECRIAVLHPQGSIEVDVEVHGRGEDARIERAALVRTARKIMQGDLHLPAYVFSGDTAQSSGTGRAGEAHHHRCADDGRWRQRCDGARHRGRAGPAARPAGHR